MNEKNTQNVIPNVDSKKKEERNVPDLRFSETPWKKVSFKDIASFYKGNGLSKDQLSNVGYECILYGELYTKYVPGPINDIVSKTNVIPLNVIYSKKNDIILPSSGESNLDISTACCVQKDNVILGGDLNIIRSKEHDGSFLCYQLIGKRKLDIAKIAQGASIVHLHNSDLEKLHLFIPSCSEDELKIAEILNLINIRINTQKKIIDNLKSLINSIINHIYSNNNYNVKLSDAITQVSNRNKNRLIDYVSSVSNKYGFIKQSDQFEDRDVASDDLSNYKVITLNDFGYNPARINVGSIARYTNNIDTVVSPMYICFKCKYNLYPEYLEYYFKSKAFKIHLLRRLEGSVRQCLTFESMQNIPFHLPNLDEQKKNAKIISAFFKKIQLETCILNKLILQKNYLLSKMFI